MSAVKRPAAARTRKKVDDTAAFEKALRSKGRTFYLLKLYVTGSTARSARAIANIRKICDEHLEGRYRLEVVDIFQQPELASKEQLVVAPTLIKKLPPPLRTFIGDLSETEKILVGLNLQAKKP